MVDPTSLGLIVPAIQLGVSLTVLTSASLLDHGAARLTTSAHAREASGEVVEITARDGAPAERAARYAALLRTVHQDPGVEIASLTSPGALDSRWRSRGLIRRVIGRIGLSSCASRSR